MTPPAFLFRVWDLRLGGLIEAALPNEIGSTKFLKPKLTLGQTPEGKILIQLRPMDPMQRDLNMM
jgi:hypothetical protein